MRRRFLTLVLTLLSVCVQAQVMSWEDFVETYDTFKEGTDSGAEPVKLQLVVHRGGRDHASVTLNGKFDICKHIMDLMHSYLEELENDFKNS